MLMKDNINTCLKNITYLKSGVNFRYKLKLQTLPLSVTYIKRTFNLILTFNAHLLLGCFVHRGVGVDCCGSGHGQAGDSYEGD